MRELDGLRNYLESPSSEDAKRHLVYPLFKRIFGRRFKTESDAAGADIYIEGRLVVELKANEEDWVRGFYQAAHYAKRGLTFSNIGVLSRTFAAVWKVSELPQQVATIIDDADPLSAPSAVGFTGANKTSKDLRVRLLRSSSFAVTTAHLSGLFGQDLGTTLKEYLNLLRNLEAARIQINPRNFIEAIEYLKSFFSTPMEAIHCFYDIVAYWDVSSRVSQFAETNKLQVIGKSGTISSNFIEVNPKHHSAFKKYIESHYVFTNEGSDLRIDHYFSRFDEVIAGLDPEYARQHGIFFTDYNLSRYAAWYVHSYVEKKLSDKYVVFDPAGGSGNLVSSWKGRLRHKVISELQPDLLRTIERRFMLDPEEAGAFSVIPKTSEHRGLNFISHSAEDYLAQVQRVLNEKGLVVDKPFAFLLNPPYKNTDEHKDRRVDKEAEYEIDPAIQQLTGDDAGKERYLAFLAQILIMARLQVGQHPTFKPLLMIFTPTSWLIGRPTYARFRQEFDKYFKFERGFMVNGKEFFAIKGRWPLAFTIWRYNMNLSGNKDAIVLDDLTDLKKTDLSINWAQPNAQIAERLVPLLNDNRVVDFSKSRESIKQWVGQTMFDFKRDPTAKEKSSVATYGGLPCRDRRRSNKKTYGITDSNYIGVMDDCTPVRVRRRVSDLRFSADSMDCVWFRFDTAFIDVNKVRCMNGPPDQKGYCAYDLDSAFKTFVWYGIAKAVNGRYPLWANQFDIWKPDAKPNEFAQLFSLSAALILAENRCVVTRFPADDPVEGAPEVTIHNPLATNLDGNFWSKVILPNITNSAEVDALIDKVNAIYNLWQAKYCASGWISNAGLEDEPYFNCFNYPDFLLPTSGLIQIRKFAMQGGKEDLSALFSELSVCAAHVRQRLFDLLEHRLNYFN